MKEHVVSSYKDPESQTLNPNYILKFSIPYLRGVGLFETQEKNFSELSDSIAGFVEALFVVFRNRV